MSDFAPPPPPPSYAAQPGGESDKQFMVTWLLALLLGVFGADRFYTNQIALGVAKLITFGGCGIWALVDTIMIITGNRKDVQGRPLAGYEANKQIAIIVTIVVWVLGFAGNIASGALSNIGG